MMAIETVNLDNAKYTVEINDETGTMTFYRHGESWPGGQKLFEHVSFIYYAMQRIIQLEKQLGIRQQ